MNILKNWMEVMEFKIEEITDKEIMITDYAWEIDGEIIIKTIKEWCVYFIEIMQYKISQDENYEEMVTRFTKEIKELQILGGLI